MERTLTTVCELRGQRPDDAEAETVELPKRFKRLLGYAQTNGIISTDEEGVLQALYNLLSNEGSHALGSKEELFHVAYATTIEWCLLLTGRVPRSS